ncbi:hypothetical protein [Rhodoferax sp. GW822-FHT02A01]|uniref:hypothetical protein n=1 Tax=Rhodoferax sp. GW822-FHT02A01 TaxID=3141537 RepID=UPI00315D6667
MTQELELLEQVAGPEKQPSQAGALVAQQGSPAAIMMQALSMGTSLEQVEKMMDLQERWEKREAEKSFRDAFAAFRGENIVIPKTKYVDRGRGGSFHQAEYSELCSRISPALSKHGFSFRHDQKFGYKRRMIEGVENDVPWVYVTCYLEHKAGHAETLELEGPPGDLSVNSPTQNMQVTASYLKRQSLLAITGTATGDEDDENGQTGSDAEDPDAVARQDGRNAAMQGLKALTAWWGKLDAKQRSRLQQDFSGMRKAAQAADAGGARA